MTAMLPEQVVKVHRDAGFRFGAGLDTIVAIAMPESGFDPLAISPPNTDGSIDYGLDQINSNHLPEGKFKTLGTNQEALDYMGRPWTKEDLLVPEHNAKAAYIISGHGSRFSAWSTFNSLAYKPYMILAATARRLLFTQLEYDNLADKYGVSQGLVTKYLGKLDRIETICIEL